MIEMTLPDMSCQHCVRAITETVRAIDPQARLEFDVPQHRVTIESTAPREALAEALAAEGYPAA